MRNVFCFNGFNCFTWFNMGRIMKDNCCFKALHALHNTFLYANRRVTNCWYFESVLILYSMIIFQSLVAVLLADMLSAEVISL